MGSKEHVKVKRESKTLATITFQNFFNKFDKKSGMTGTALTEEKEFRDIYGMDVIEIPTNRPVIRVDKQDAVYKTKKEKYHAVVEEVKAAHAKGQPVLVGTITIDVSETISAMLKREGIQHTVLNAKFHELEAEIVAAAGQHGAVTIATNMAGRGTDIKLDDDAKEAGGLKVIGTERHESRRIDNQLRGRSGRQGDPGESQFFISLEDDLMRLFGSERLMSVFNTLGVEDGEQIETDDLYKRREKYNCEVPEEVLVLTAGVDVQDDRFEAEVVGWGVDKESWGIKYQVIYGDLKLKPVWDELDRFLSQTFTTADGRHLKIICACVDSGGHFTTQVYRFCKERTARRVFAIKGKGGAEVPYFNRPSTANNIKTPLFTVGVDTGKALLYQRLAVQEEGPNYCHFPREKDRGYTQEYFKGLTAEKMVISYKRGKAQYVWTLKDGGYKRNEPLDIRNYATVALEIANPILKPPEHDTTAPAPRRRGRRSRTNGGIL